MLSLYRAWLGPNPCVARPGPPPGAHRPVPRRARPPSPASSTSSELDVERVEAEPERQSSGGAILDVASCDGPVRFSRVLNTAYRSGAATRAPHCYPCKTCGCKFPSYYFVHKHRKACHREEPPSQLDQPPKPSTSTASNNDG